ncbi:MAG: Tetratricopeptide 1 repeat-containing protein [Bacteroidetes bacterium]|jgi:tetratricopeptide (TPR) repeat protein|nr:Tetratricopeptide 1 repeat-containing protein [Bacteroidota bacterium]
MKKLIFIFAVLMSVSGAVTSQNNPLKKANDLYSRGDYEGAAVAYEQIIKEQGVAPELYFNLGNAYYKLNETGKSILNYERALRLDPSYDDARFNLNLAGQKVVDNVVQVPSFFLVRWLDILTKQFNSNQWFVVSLTIFILSLVGFLIFVFGVDVRLRKLSFYIAGVFLGAALVTLFFSGIRKNQLMGHKEAVIMSGVIVVKSSPDKSGTDLFQLHEGTKVKVKSSLGEWTEIVVGNGGVGWVENNAIEKI